MSELIRWEVRLGSVVLPRCGPIVTDADGWSHFQMSDYYELDHYGAEVPGTRRPGEVMVRWRNDDRKTVKPWWKFWA